MKLHFFVFLLALSWTLASCMSLSPKAKKTKAPEVSHDEKSSSKFYDSLSDRSYKSSYGKIPIVDHPDVNKWIRYFTGKGRGYMQSYLQRSQRYLPLMQSILKENDLPLDLVYVALIESGFSPRAFSTANAVGYWQFIYGTGKRYGLRIDGFVDERRDPILSTRAAANYFKNLYSLFGSWELALASYNAGEYKVNRGIFKHYNRNFWFLSDRKALPRETRNYVPKLIAAIKIAKNPRRYGFYMLKYEEPIQYDVVHLKKSISLKKLAQKLEVDYKELKRLNPMYKGEYVPIYNSDAHVRVPVGKLALAKASLAQIHMAAPKYSYNYHYWYKVRKGDSLSRIARKHKVSLKKLRQANNMRRKSLIHAGQRLKIPQRRLVATKTNSKVQRSPASNSEFYRVRKGQTLSQIARLNGMKLSTLKALNNITSSRHIIHPGDKLRVRTRTPARVEFYRVRKGQTLSQIAELNGMGLSEIKKLNNIKSSRHIIHPGDKLRVKAKKKETLSHVVKKGETLIGIADLYNTDLPRLMKANSINFKSVLLTGTKLVIPKN